VSGALEYSDQMLTQWLGCVSVRCTRGLPTFRLLSGGAGRVNSVLLDNWQKLCVQSKVYNDFCQRRRAENLPAERSLGSLSAEGASRKRLAARLVQGTIFSAQPKGVASCWRLLTASSAKSLSLEVARVNTAGRSDCCPGRPGGKFVESGGLLSFRPALYSWGGVTIHPKAWNCSVPNDLADYL